MNLKIKNNKNDIINFKFKGKSVAISHMDCFIKPFENEFQLRKTYFEELSSNKIVFKKIYSSQKDYFLIINKKYYKKWKRSILFDILLPVQSIFLKKVLEFPEGRYIIGSEHNNYEFIRDSEFAYSAREVVEKNEYFYNNNELIRLALNSLEDKKDVFIRI